MTPQANAKRISDALAAIKAHCMCLRFEETESKYRVLYPEGFALGGTQISKALGKGEALERLLGYMEKHWQESFP